MDDRRFDALARLFAGSTSRRAILKGVLGVGGIATIGSLPLDAADAARRPRRRRNLGCALDCRPRAGMDAPARPECPIAEPIVVPTDRLSVVMAPAATALAGEEFCCPYPDQYCSVDGRCSGVCVENGQYCCPSGAACGDACCHDSESCCAADPNAPVCRPVGACCFDTDCEDGICDQGTCTPNPPPRDPSFEITFSSVGSGFCSPIVSMSGFTPNTTYHYRLDLRRVSTGQTDTLFLFDKTTDGLGNATATNRADITGDLFEVQAFMDAFESDWVLVSC